MFVAGADGGGTKRITSTPENETGVEFSPDGKTLTYASERGGKWAIYEARRQRAAEPYFYASTVVTETPIFSNEKQKAQPKNGLLYQIPHYGVQNDVRAGLGVSYGEGKS